MDKKYEINIKRTDYGHLTITAKNEKETKRKAFLAEEKGETIWHQSETKINKIKPI